MNHDLIKWYNELVDEGDRVYLLGDVAFTARMMHEVIPQLKGRICLIPGNHEPPGMRKYFDLFQDVRGYIQRKGRSEEHTSDLQSLMRITYAVLCLKKNT